MNFHQLRIFGTTLVICACVIAGIATIQVADCSIDHDKECIAQGGHLEWQPTGQATVVHGKAVPVWAHVCVSAQP